MSEIVKYKEFLDSCIKSPIEEVIRDYYECNKELRTDLESIMIEREQLREERNILAYENKNMSEFLKYNDKTLTDSDVGDIATSTIDNNIWARFRTNAQFDKDGELIGVPIIMGSFDKYGDTI